MATRDHSGGAASTPCAPAPDVVVLGAGFAGSLAALVLARQGFRVCVVDPQAQYARDFRCEKLGPEQAELLREMGLLDLFAPAGWSGGPITPADVIAVGMSYEEMVGRLRRAWPEAVDFRIARAQSAELGDDLQEVVLSDGARLRARLVVLASGRGERLRRSLGVQRRQIRARHSLCIGFTLRPKGADVAPPLSRFCHGPRAGAGLAFVSLFPMGEATRVNLFSYRDPASPWARAFRADPLDALGRTFPGLRPALAGLEAVGPADFGVTDLYETEGWLKPGLVLIGDAFRSCCPATGMGLTRILVEVRQLAFAHLPAWLATPGMPAAKIADFYDDPVKLRVDQSSFRKAERGRLVAASVGLKGFALRAAAALRRACRALPAPRAWAGSPYLETQRG